MASPSSHSWRELLGQLTERPAERQRAAEALGVTPYTITRWVNGESEPRLQNLKRLPDIFPAHQQHLAELVQADLTPNVSGHAATVPFTPQTQVPVELLTRLLSAYAHMSGPFRAWSIRTLALQVALEHLDPDTTGIQFSIVQCVPPHDEMPVRTLCVRLSMGTSPWDVGVRSRLIFLGAESLGGWMLGRERPVVVSDLQQLSGIWPSAQSGQGQAAASWPFLREGKLAGCLLVASMQNTFWTAERLQILEVYANAIALSFRDEEFIPLHQVMLHEIPTSSRSEESRLLSQMRERVNRMRREQGYRLSEFEAERLVFQQMEEELLGPSHP